MGMVPFGRRGGRGGTDGGKGGMGKGRGVTGWGHAGLMTEGALEVWVVLLREGKDGGWG